MTSSILQNIQSPLELFHLNHAQSEQTPTNSNKACVCSKPSSTFLRVLSIASGLLNFFLLKSTESDPNATISPETHNLGKLDLFNRITYCLRKLQPFLLQHVYSELKSTFLREPMVTSWKKRQNIYPLQTNCQHAYSVPVTTI